MGGADEEMNTGVWEGRKWGKELRGRRMTEKRWGRRVGSGGEGEGGVRRYE